MPTYEFRNNETKQSTLVIADNPAQAFRGIAQNTWGYQLLRSPEEALRLSAAGAKTIDARRHDEPQLDLIDTGGDANDEPPLGIG